MEGFLSKRGSAMGMQGPRPRPYRHGYINHQRGGVTEVHLQRGGGVIRASKRGAGMDSAPH